MLNNRVKAPPQFAASRRLTRLSQHVLVRSQAVGTAEAPVQQKELQKNKETVATPSVPPAERRQQANVRINVIPKSQWSNGVPPVMGAHLMPSGRHIMLHACYNTCLFILCIHAKGCAASQAATDTVPPLSHTPDIACSAGATAPVSTSRGPGLGGVPHSFHYSDKEVDADVVQFPSADTGDC